MKTRLFYFILSMVVLLAGCSDEYDAGSNGVSGNYTLDARIENEDATQSRTTVNDAGQVLWTENDRIGVYGNLNSRNVPFTLASGIGTASGSFRGDLPTGEEAEMAYYPYDENAERNGNTLTFTLPADYTYTGNSNAPMLGVKNEDGTFRFRHLAGLLKIVIHGAPEDASKFVITSEGDNAPGLAGNAQVTDITAAEPVLALTGEVSRTITYKLPDRIDDELCFYVPMPAGTYPKLVVKLLKADDSEYLTKTISNRKIRRAVMVEMPVLTHVSPEYVDIDWNKAKVESMNLDNGDFTLTFDEGTMPEFADGESVVVLQDGNSFHLRRIMNSTVNDNQVTIHTQEAGMTELFRNTEFSLSLTPENQAATRTATGKVLYPVRILRNNEDGSYTTLYDQTVSTRVEAEVRDTIPLVDVDLSGEEIASKGYFTLSWESYKQQLDLTALAHFKFGDAIREKEITEDLRVRISDLEECRFTLGASALFEMIPKASANGEYELSVKEHELLPMLRPYTFIFMAGGVPVAITLSCDLLADFSLNGEAEASMTGGITMEGDINAGVEYIKQTNEWQPIGDASFSYEVHPLEFEGAAEMNMRATAYPKMEIKLYDFVGPTFAPKPVLEDTVKAGFYNQVGSSSEDYYGWTQKAYTAMEFHSSVQFNFLGWFEPELELPVLTVGKRQVHNAPEEIQLVSPDEGKEVPINETTTVTFNVTQMLLDTPQPLAGVVVKFETRTGRLDKTYAISDLEGNVNVEWTPIEYPASLFARIYDAEGEVISEAKFIPKFPITGRWWLPTAWILPQPKPQPDTELSENYLEFFEDGTFEECYNPFKKVCGTSASVVYPDSEYGPNDPYYTYLLERWHIRRGTYYYSDTILRTQTTYYHEKYKSQTYNIQRHPIGGNEYETYEIPSSELSGGEIRIIDENNIEISNPRNSTGWMSYRRITEDFMPELLDTPDPEHDE